VSLHSVRKQDKTGSRRTAQQGEEPPRPGCKRCARRDAAYVRTHRRHGPKLAGNLSVGRQKTHPPSFASELRPLSGSPVAHSGEFVDS